MHTEFSNMLPPDPQDTPDPMPEISAERLLRQHEYLEEGFALAARRAGRGPDAVLERRLLSQARALRGMLEHPAAARALTEASDAARRAMDCVSPEVPLHALTLAREVLARHVRRQAMGLPRRQAA